MPEFLHAADFHLDSAFAALTPDLAAQRRKEQRNALQLLVDASRGCDFVLLSGDLFDSARVYRDTLDALHECFAAIGIPIYIAPGNHDCLAPGSPYLTETWEPNVYIFKNPVIERLELESCDLYGAGFTSPEMPCLLNDFHVADTNRLNIMCLHADLIPRSSYCPINGPMLLSSGLDYAALGHTHTNAVYKFGYTTAAYPGCLMGRGFDECGQKGVLRVRVDKSGATTQFIPIPSRKYEQIHVEAGNDPLASILEVLPENTLSDCYRIYLTGTGEVPDCAALESQLASRFFSVSVIDRTEPSIDLWKGIDEDSLRGLCLRDLKIRYDAAEEDEQAEILDAVRIVIGLIDGREVAL